VLNLIQLETADMDIDVLIVGAGPTEIMLANQLGRRGVAYPDRRHRQEPEPVPVHREGPQGRS
jgi:2-polyprenyl-6-methoxyphenol hydroxylase-like FAD-dependent oxidoreductase